MAREWRREDAVVALAAYMDRPRGFRLPPSQEVQRLANLLETPVDVVRARLRAFATLDADNAVEDGEVTPSDASVWAVYEGHPARLFGDADHIVYERRVRPHPVWRRLQRRAARDGRDGDSGAVHGAP